jgi:hypothetical protein
VRHAGGIGQVGLDEVGLAAVQGGLLLSQVRRSPDPLIKSVDTMIDYLRTLSAP